uniref:G-protein coupled receptors family 1 profile domain-containing protein n=1 Tax=Acrobeloides nanus TaxID=290746 RepID=A0A914DQM1_9BILA
MCHLLPFVQAVSVFVSTFSLSAIAIDRYNLVIRPHARSLSPRSAVLVASVLWVLSVIVSLPYGYYMKLESYPGYCGQFCSEHWTNQHIRRGYSLVVLMAQFVLPFATMLICYSSVFMKLNERNKTKLKKLNERMHLLKTLSKMAFSPTPSDIDS